MEPHIYKFVVIGAPGWEEGTNGMPWLPKINWISGCSGQAEPSRVHNTLQGFEGLPKPRI